MRYVAAYLLASLGSGKVSAAEIEKILGSVGIEADKEKITKIIGELKGKNLEELIEEGQKKLASVPTGGVASSGGSAAPAGGEAKTEEKKEAKKEESESEDEDMGFGLFD